MYEKDHINHLVFIYAGKTPVTFLTGVTVGPRLIGDVSADERAAALVALCINVKCIARVVGISVENLIDCLPVPLVKICVPGRG